jgi:hypothetical protein
MKLVPLIFMLCFLSCNESAVPKPDKLLNEETIEAIVYDLVLLEAIKNSQPNILEDNGINPYEYIYEKYQIDSLQWVQNNKYYASDVKNYKHLFDRVRIKLEQQKADNDSLLLGTKNKTKKLELDTIKPKKPRKRLIPTP